MRKTLFLTLLVSAGLMAQPPGPRGRMGFGPGPGPMGPGGPGEMGRTVTGQPYSAVQVRTSQQTLPGGNVIQTQSQTSIHRDSQGRTRTESEFTLPGQTTPIKRISIHDPVAGMAHELDPANKTARSISLHGPGPAGARGPNGAGPNGAGPMPRMAGGPGVRNPNAQGGRQRPVDPNVKTEDLGTQSINGVLATGTRTTRTIPAGAIGNAAPIETIHERWVSSDLGVPVRIKTSDPRFGTTVTELTNVSRSEPDSALFTVPSDYTVSRGGRGPGGAGRPPRAGQDR